MPSCRTLLRPLVTLPRPLDNLKDLILRPAVTGTSSVRPTRARVNQFFIKPSKQASSRCRVADQRFGGTLRKRQNSRSSRPPVASQTRWVVGVLRKSARTAIRSSQVTQRSRLKDNTESYPSQLRCGFADWASHSLRFSAVAGRDDSSSAASGRTVKRITPAVIASPREFLTMARRRLANRPGVYFGNRPCSTGEKSLVRPSFIKATRSAFS